ncbi:MAG: beta-N-acetylhexosaminidase [Cystobacterineae bacterium]|nr:beta-N-acetylhexosaminidase [Cystobacterineae bacterium]
MLSPAKLSEEEARVEALLSKLSLEEKLGQMMMVGFAGRTLDEATRAMLERFHVGGICLFKRNISSSQQVALLNEALYRFFEGKIPPFIAVDQEGGNVIRIDDSPMLLPSAMALGATGSAELALKAGKAMGEDLRLLGFNMNLAPVVELSLNLHNNVMGTRSFGSNPEAVATLGKAFIRGQQGAQMVTVAKHFPGHGHSAIDSHRDLPMLEETEAQMRLQWGPFQAIIEQGLDAMMTAHVSLPNISGDAVPATLSPRLLEGILRSQLNFEGLVLTDELEMEAISKQYAAGHAAIMAIEAGADMVLIPWQAQKKEEVFLALHEAAMQGRLSEERINTSVRRLLRVKLKRGLFAPLPPLSERQKHFGKNRALEEHIAEAALTLLKNDNRLLPLKKQLRLALFMQEQTLAKGLAEQRTAELFSLSAVLKKPTKAGSTKPNKALERAAQADVVVVAISSTRQLPALHRLAPVAKKLVVIVLGNPLLLESLPPQVDALLIAYSYLAASQRAAAKALRGEIDTPGKLPVAAGNFPLGHGMSLLQKAPGKTPNESTSL